ncbi:MAG: ATP-binding protein [Phycisphaerae bacterium]
MNSRNRASNPAPSASQAARSDQEGHTANPQRIGARFRLRAPREEAPPLQYLHGHRYTLGMAEDIYRDMTAYLSFGEEDARALAELKDPLRPYFHDIVDHFYAILMKNEPARSVLEANRIHIEDLREKLTLGLGELFDNHYGIEYFEKRCRIGRRHVRVNLPQHYMFTAMNIIRLDLAERILKLDPDAAPRRLAALHKILDLELAIMNETYREDLIGALKKIEQTRYEQKLSESEHLASVGQLAASLAHEIKNPLAGISGAIQVLGAGLEPGHPHKEVISEVLHQIDRLDAAVKDLLIYARPKPPQRRPIDLGKILERAMILFREEPAFRNVNVICDGLDEEIIIDVDEIQIQQVISNLLLNAAHACESDGNIICSIQRDDSRIRILIEDDGAGIPPMILSRVFEPFFTTKARGTGLGLPICKRIVEIHGGKLAIDSRVGEGTRVTIDILG